MTRYFFHRFAQGERTEDTEGREFATVEEAERHAQNLVCDLMRDWTLSQRMKHFFMQVETADETVHFTIKSTIRRSGKLDPWMEAKMKGATDAEAYAATAPDRD